MFSFLFHEEMSCRDKTDSKLRKKVMPAKEAKIYSFENIEILFSVFVHWNDKTRSLSRCPIVKLFL